MTPLQDCEGVRCHGLFSGSCSFFDEALPGSWTLVLAGVAREAMRPRRRWVCTAERRRWY